MRTASLRWSFKLFNSKRKSKEIIKLIPDEDGHLTKINGKKVEAFNAFFVPFFNNTDKA